MFFFKSENKKDGISLHAVSGVTNMFCLGQLNKDLTVDAIWFGKVFEV